MAHPRSAVAAIVIALLLLVSAALLVAQQLSNSVTRDFVFDIPQGENLVSVTDRLYEQGDLPVQPLLFKYLGLLTERDGPILAGQYQVEAGMTAAALLNLFRSGDVIQYRVTFPEGWTLGNWRTALANAPGLAGTIADMDERQIAEALDVSGPVEGWLFPDTYQYVQGDTDMDLLKRALQRMRSVIDMEWSARNESVELTSPYEALILASIIEKETGLAEDRAKIASVFHNRLAIGMRLQSDPTVIFGMGSNFDGDLKRRHLKTDTPYNSYTRYGLPPGPICSPGRAAIKAALAGSSHPYLYFVAMGDGRSYFSEDLEEHNRAVDRYQRQAH